MRYKEFNRNKVLETCITLFWKNGFNSCSINEIVKKTGVNRFSLYKEFQDKEGILINALQLYLMRYVKKHFEILAQDKPLRDSLLNFFSTFINDKETHPPGCFIIHIATELADKNQKVKGLLETYIDALESHFNKVLQRNDETVSNSSFFAKHLTGLFCTSMCFSVIQSYEERISHINNSINILFKNKKVYVQNNS